MIRPAEAADAAAIQALYEDGLLDAPWRPGRTGSEPTFEAVSGGETVVVATDDAGAVQGVVSVFRPDAFIHHLYVGTPFRRRGVGTALLASLAPWLPGPWRLKCVRANTTALAFYADRGWREIDGGVGDDGEYALLECDRAGSDRTRRVKEGP